MMATEPMGGSYGGGQDILSEATNSIVLPMTAEGVQSMQYNPNMNSTSIVGETQTSNKKCLKK